MTTLPLIRDTNPGIYQAITDTTTTDHITVPAGAAGLVLWFETSASDATQIGGRVGFDQAATDVTVTNTNIGWHPAMPVEYDLADEVVAGVRTNVRDAYVHVACATAGAICKGMWLFHQG